MDPDPEGPRTCGSGGSGFGSGSATLAPSLVCYIRYHTLCAVRTTFIYQFFLFRDEDDLFEDMEMTEALVKDEEDLIAQVLKVKKEC
jgi:hypothetical protein